jgi:hypothetical protein
MAGRGQFSLRSIFWAIFWVAATFGLLRLLPQMSPARLVEFLAIDSSQQAPFVLVIPAALLVGVAATSGAAIGTLRCRSWLYAVSFSKLAFAALLIYFAVMAWIIWTDDILTFLYTLTVVAILYVLFFRSPRRVAPVSKM